MPCARILSLPGISLEGSMISAQDKACHSCPRSHSWCCRLACLPCICHGDIHRVFGKVDICRVPSAASSLTNQRILMCISANARPIGLVWPRILPTRVKYLATVGGSVVRALSPTEFLVQLATVDMHSPHGFCVETRRVEIHDHDDGGVVKNALLSPLDGRWQCGTRAQRKRDVCASR
jgi:hypothetical protein